MGTTSSKEEVIIAQTASGGTNAATVTQEQLTTVSAILLFIAVCLAVVIAGVALRMYKRCHQGWVEEKIQQREVQKAVQMA